MTPHEWADARIVASAAPRPMPPLIQRPAPANGCNGLRLGSGTARLGRDGGGPCTDRTSGPAPAWRPNALRSKRLRGQPALDRAAVVRQVATEQLQTTE